MRSRSMGLGSLQGSWHPGLQYRFYKRFHVGTTLEKIRSLLRDVKISPFRRMGKKEVSEWRS